MILLDMDGVLCDLQPEIGKLFGFREADVERLWRRGQYMIHAGLDLDEAEVWRRMAAAGEEFWSEMPETPWARKLYDGARALGDVYFATAPTQEPHSASGKLKWLQQFVGDKGMRNFMMGAPKHLCAKPNVALVDDSDENIYAFMKAGGHGVLFPRAWNCLEGLRVNPGEYALAELRRWVAREAR